MKSIFKWIMDQIKGCPDLPPDPRYAHKRCPVCADEGVYVKDGVTTICSCPSKPYHVTSDGCAYRDGQPGQIVFGPDGYAKGGDGGRGQKKNGENGNAD